MNKKQKNRDINEQNKSNNKLEDKEISIADVGPDIIYQVFKVEH